MRLIRLLAAPAAAALFILAGLASPAAAHLLIEIDKSSQSMTVSQDGERLHRWPVSTGVRAYATPSGAFTPFRMEKDHFSREWDDAPMPHSIFFTKQGHAIHGTNHLRAIGSPASHGCVRLEPEHARELFALVRRVGMANTRVTLHGDTPELRAPAMARTPRSDERPVDRARYEQRPGYIDPWNDVTYSIQPNGLPRAERVERAVRSEARTGYWVQYPDGSRAFVDRERDPRTLPPRPPGLFGGPFGGN